MYQPAPRPRYRTCSPTICGSWDPTTPDTLSTRKTRPAGGAGDPDAAAAALQELLADRLRVLGPNHPTPRRPAKASRTD